MLEKINNEITKMQMLLSNRREVITCTHKIITIQPKKISAVEYFTDLKQIDKSKQYKIQSIQTFDKYVYGNQYKDQNIQSEFYPEDNELWETNEYIEFTEQGDTFHYMTY